MTTDPCLSVNMPHRSPATKRLGRVALTLAEAEGDGTNADLLPSCLPTIALAEVGLLTRSGIWLASSKCNEDRWPIFHYIKVIPSVRL